ncbi:hypothetical protein BC940DRAFT_304130 [Gongronella butleri]|nr:hypothetical protein BC940DRAFT_304130 [Gongronella butleri]
MELPHIGIHCALPSCGSLDYLPVACPFCQAVYCGDHRLPGAHECHAWVKRDKKVAACTKCQQLVFESALSEEEALKAHLASQCQMHVFPPVSAEPRATTRATCHVLGCRDLDPRIGPAHCAGCDQDYCLKHRYPSAHDCASLKVDTKALRRTQAAEKLAKTFPSTATSAASASASAAQPTQPSPRETGKVTKKRPGNPKIELMKIKAKAKGIGSVPMASRLYVHVQFPKETKMAAQPMFLDMHNRAGKTLDLLADHARLNNINHQLAQDHPDRLVLFQQEGDDGSPMALDLSKTMEQVAPLSTVILERAGQLQKEE